MLGTIIQPIFHVNFICHVNVLIFMLRVEFKSHRIIKLKLYDNSIYLDKVKFLNDILFINFVLRPKFEKKSLHCGNI
jgi:hypothetical protein